MGAKELANYTYDEYLQIDASTPESERYELIFGHIYMMSGASALHQDIVGSIFYILKRLQQETKCKPRLAPFDLKVECQGSTNVVQPDLLLYCKEERLPCAIFEVLSPSTAYKDKTVKKDLYESCGVQNYFIVDPKAKTIDKFLLENGKYNYIGCFGLPDSMMIECMDKKVEVAKLFDEEKPKEDDNEQ
ncbi:hypothetical protein MNB_SM-7-552 [hydrothermal vent metagenome]|uniref:Putative restriction endonuclease domain-containing protein n=1 Tax=hydrothermal vent metagenome TaxID=652676 RepID=A0A1W1C6V1_9ZZZZ